MKQFKWFLSLSLLCMVLMGCGDADQRGPITAKEIATYQLAKKCSKTLCDRYGMISCHKTEHLMHEIKDIFLAFHVDRRLPKQEIRAVLIDCAHEVITAVHQSPEVKRHLPPWGFNKKNVRIQVIMSPETQGSNEKQAYVCTFKSGKLTYKTYDLQDTRKYKVFESETYKEALTLLESTQVL